MFARTVRGDAGNSGVVADGGACSRLVAREVAIASRHGRRARHPHRGFTLLELLVAMVLFALLSSALYGAVRLVSRAGEAGERAAAQGERMRVVGDFLDRYIGQAMPLTATGRARQGVLFEGERSRLTFVTELPELAGQAGPQEVVLEAGGPGGAALMLGYRSLRTALDGGFGRGEYRWRRVADGLGALRFEYHGRQQGARRAEWHDEWRDTTSLPGLVRVVLAPVAREDDWPEFVVRVRSDALRVVRVTGR